MHKRIYRKVLYFALFAPLMLSSISIAMAENSCATNDPPPCITCSPTIKDGELVRHCSTNYLPNYYNITYPSGMTTGTNIVYKFCKAVAENVSSPVTYYYQQICDDTTNAIRLTTAYNEHMAPTQGNWPTSCNDPTGQCICKGANPAVSCPFTNKPF